MGNENDNRKDQEPTPDALGNDKRQGEDMAKAGKANQTDIHTGDDELKKDPEEPQERDTDTIGIP